MDPQDTTKSGGKKSGSMLVAAEKVVEQIDWPHMYVYRYAARRQKGVPYGDLRIDKFVFGFISMLESPKCAWDYQTMTRVLRMLMRDAMDFSWENARAFYELVGRVVEHGVMEWTDKERITEMRMTHSRANFPEKRAAKDTKDTTRGPPKSAPADTRCCAAFQKRECKLMRDHAPYTHACAYCLRTCNLLCRHAENECIRKVMQKTERGGSSNAPSLIHTE